MATNLKDWVASWKGLVAKEKCFFFFFFFGFLLARPRLRLLGSICCKLKKTIPPEPRV